MVCIHTNALREADYQDGVYYEQKIFNKLQQMGYIVKSTSRYEYFDFNVNNKYIVEARIETVTRINMIPLFYLYRKSNNMNYNIKTHTWI